MKLKFLSLLPLIAILFIALSCDKEKEDDATPVASIEGTWKVSGVASVSSDGTRNEGYMTLLKLAYKCIDQVSYTFKDGKYTSDVPSGCSESDGLISASSGTYTIDGNTIIVNTDGTPIGGTIAFSGNTAIVTTPNPTDLTGKLEITFTKQ